MSAGSIAAPCRRRHHLTANLLASRETVGASFVVYVASPLFCFVWSFPTPHISLSDPHPICARSPGLLWHVIFTFTCIYSTRLEAGQTSRFIPLTRVQIYLSETLTLGNGYERIIVQIQRVTLLSGRLVGHGRNLNLFPTATALLPIPNENGTRTITCRTRDSSN